MLKGVKRCNGCKLVLPLENFANMTASPDGKQYKCRQCMNIWKKGWEARNVARVRESRRHADIRRYGIEPADYDRMLAEQNGLCGICEQPEPTPGHSLHIDHCHDTGVVRGLLCGRCNRALGMFKDNTEVMARAIAYLHAYTPAAAEG